MSQATAPARGALSEALVELIRPHHDEAIGLGEYQELIALGALAWNLTLLPEAERGEAITSALRGVKIHEPDVVREMLQVLAGRKEQLFPHDRRLIVEYEVTPTPTGYHVAVASASAADA